MRSEQEIIDYLEYVKLAKLEALKLNRSKTAISLYSALIREIEWVLEVDSLKYSLKHGNKTHYKNCKVV